ncbi:acyloxyacyl hydrolase [Pseudoalteromonas ruthenica]|uniref:acyloxyacyl hydrolase n=1 Tax=Pseudoalteromonas ruthenica TaxID=151081 RepID=UPI0003459D71|nr:acyloxyacyl hydrolase [Pseudoalteromonas ruthenica]TMO90310.1 acyloxyacyl hydrolase [Pseudoalteromonas ruthenica]TMP23618.1 acyloxyacyl hydrolase [Pseudoalteromonas ruthenica]
MKAVIIPLTLALSSLVITPAQAEPRHGVASHYIQGEGDVKGIKLAYQYYVNDYLPEQFSQFDVYFETSINFWRYGKDNQHDQNVVVALSPVFQYPMTTFKGRPLVLEFGIGVSLLDDTQFAGKNVSTHYQFEDRVGVVYKMENADIGVRYMHYSNAGFKSPNPGLDFISFSYTHFF